MPDAKKIDLTWELIENNFFRPTIDCIPRRREKGVQTESKCNPSVNNADL